MYHISTGAGRILDSSTPAPSLIFYSNSDLALELRNEDAGPGPLVHLQCVGGLRLGQPHQPRHQEHHEGQLLSLIVE